MARMINDLDHDPSALFIFIGASPGYVYHAFDELFDSRNHYSVPLSAFRLDRRPTPQQVDRFQRYIFSIVPREQIETSKQIYLIDHSHSSSSIISFVYMLHLIIEKELPIVFVNLVDKKMIRENIYYPFLPTVTLLSSTLNDVSGRDFLGASRNIF
jgi:hypothetical protein